MIRIISFTMICLLFLQLVPTAKAQSMAERQIRRLPLGAQIEVRLKNREKLRGTKGKVNQDGFVLFDEASNEIPIAFADVWRVREYHYAGSRKGDYILFAATVGVGIALAVVMGVRFANRCQSLSCAGK